MSYPLNLAPKLTAKRGNQVGAPSHPSLFQLPFIRDIMLTYER
jgi:hypothetical protein